jgi:hypothetical protein
VSVGRKILASKENGNRCCRLFDGSVNCSQCLNKNSGHVFDFRFFWTGNGARKVKPTVWMDGALWLTKKKGRNGSYN